MLVSTRKKTNLPSSLSVQMLAEAQQMQNEVLELRVQTAITGNEVARMDNPILLARMQTLSLTADRILAGKDE